MASLSDETGNSVGLTLPGAFGTRSSNVAPFQRVPLTMFRGNRDRLAALFRAEGLSGLMLFKGAEQQTRNETDHEPLMRQESFFAHLFGAMESGCYGVIDEDGYSTLFIPRLPPEYRIWMGTIPEPGVFTAKYGVDATKYVDELLDFFTQNRGEIPTIHTLHGENSDTGESGPPLPNFEGFAEKLASSSTSTALRRLAVENRVIKSEEEILLLRHVNDITSDAHIEVMRAAKPGMFEYQLESIFLHHCYYNGGCRMAAYASICGCGPNGSVLHYGHAGAPNDRRIENGDMLLLDMGTELRCYCSDVTCSFPCSIDGKFTAEQRLIFDTVSLCQQNVMKAMAPGVQWADMHEIAYRTICERLTEAGLLRGPLEDMMEANIASFFMPHGLGHLIGCDTHDVGGYPEGTERDARRGFKSLRMQRPLLAGMVLTVEPGVYFIDLLLDELLTSPATKAFAVAEEVNRFRGFGGVRLEDSVLVTETGVQNLTTCPRTSTDVEAVRAGKITDKSQLSRLI